MRLLAACCGYYVKGVSIAYDENGWNHRQSWVPHHNVLHFFTVRLDCWTYKTHTNVSKSIYNVLLRITYCLFALPKCFSGKTLQWTSDTKQMKNHFWTYKDNTFWWAQEYWEFEMKKYSFAFTRRLLPSAVRYAKMETLSFLGFKHFP